MEEASVHEPSAEPEAVSIAGIRQAAARIGPHVHYTPVMTCRALDEMSGGREVFFKCELFQKTGSFKARGACNAVLLTPPECRDIVTHSSGNHAQVRCELGIVQPSVRACSVTCAEYIGAKVVCNSPKRLRARARRSIKTCASSNRGSIRDCCQMQLQATSTITRGYA